MRIANVAGRATLVTDSGGIDIAHCSNGRFGPDPQSLFDDWPLFSSWARDALDSANPCGPAQPYRPEDLRPPVPAPRQIFAIGLNYASHAAESGSEHPTFPATFTKFVSSLTGPVSTVDLPSEYVDWEIELVVAIGRPAYRVDEADGWTYVAGLSVGQDLSDRMVQLRPPQPQFSLGKSFPGFSPVGPYLVTPDEFTHIEDLELICTLNGETMQQARTTDMIFGVARLIAHLSSVLPLLPGDLIFTGTPAGVGAVRDPRKFLQPGDELVSTIVGIGSLNTKFLERGTR